MLLDDFVAARFPCRETERRQNRPIQNRTSQLKAVPKRFIQAASIIESRMWLNSECYSRYMALLQACGGESQIAVVSGYRLAEQQHAIYEGSLAENGPAFTESYVARPYESEHQTGLAVDVGLRQRDMNYICPTFPNEGACGLFKQYAPRFGFVQRYQTHKSSITGIASEPWHYRYVGYPHALFMEQLDLCLEEYAELLARYGQSGQKLSYGNDSDYHYDIFYVRAEGSITRVSIPAVCEAYTISGNNKDGFIMTTAYKKRQ